MSHDANLDRSGALGRKDPSTHRSTAMDALLRLGNSRVVSIGNLFVAALLAYSVLFGSNPSYYMLLAGFLIYHSVRSLRARASGTAAGQGQ
jgi:hypothetical protein